MYSTTVSNSDLEEIEAAAASSSSAKDVMIGKLLVDDALMCNVVAFTTVIVAQSCKRSQRERVVRVFECTCTRDSARTSTRLTNARGQWPRKLFPRAWRGVQRRARASSVSVSLSSLGT